MIQVNCLLGQGVYKLRFEVFMAVRIQNTIFWATTSNGLVGGYKRFGANFCLLLQCVMIMGTADSSEMW
jgi:hypothetical protein